MVLAHAGALRSLAKGHRRNAIWTAAAAVPDKDILRGTERDAPAPALPAASEGIAVRLLRSATGHNRPFDTWVQIADNWARPT